MFRAHVLETCRERHEMKLIVKQILHYTASGIITPIGVMIPKAV